VALGVLHVIHTEGTDRLQRATLHAPADPHTRRCRTPGPSKCGRPRRFPSRRACAPRGPETAYRLWSTDASHRPRVRPRPLRHIFLAVHASHAIQQENQKAPQGTNKRISSFRSPDLNTAMVSSMSIACICKARSIKRRPVWVSSTIRLRRSLASDVLRSSFWDSRRSAAAVIEPLVRSTFFPMVSSDLVEFPEGRDEHC
jgi:hypothetical protein